MQQELNEKQVLDYILKYFELLDKNFDSKNKKKLPFQDLKNIMDDMNVLFNKFYDLNPEKCSKLSTMRYIPLLNLVVKLDKDGTRAIEYMKYLKNAYRMSARTSLENYFIYREWEDTPSERFFAPRYEIMRGYIYYLEQIVTNPNVHCLIANMPSGYGKLIANDVPVLTKNGWKKHGDLEVGDYVISPSGEFVRVNIVHPKRFANCRVEFEDGEIIYCHNQHEWEMFDRYARKEKHLETNDMIGKLKTSDGHNRFLINHEFIVKGEKKNLPVDPYTYGVWLGDGSTCQGRITENIEDEEIFNYIPYKISSKVCSNSSKAYFYYLKGLSLDLHKIGLCYQNKKVEKFIDSEYLTADIDQRLELLAGLIDTDGYLDKVKQRYIISTTNEYIRDGILTLVNSFGWRTCITEVPPMTSSSGIVGKKTMYYIGFSPTFNVPCKLKRKQLDRFHKQRMIGVKSIEFCDLKEGNCITVDGGLYLVGRTLKMTHNTYPEKVSEAWAFGRDPSGTVLSLCSNEDVVKGGSRVVIDEMKSEWFGEVFPEMAWNEDKKNYFLKETDSNWKLKQCKLVSSYYAKTVQSNVVGVRASQRIHIDDLYADYKEAMSQNLNEYYLNKHLTVWSKRFVQNMIPKVVVTGTLWASGDFIALLIKLQKKRHKFTKHPKYKYTWISEDGSVVIIQVPALDYETGLSTCPELKTTKELLIEKSNMDEYLWETNFQQRPTDPDALFFSYSKLRTYETIPKTDFMGGYAVIDATRKSGKDFFAMPIFTKVPNENGYDYYLKDCLFTRTATKDMYYQVAEKIMEHHIIELVIESNVTSELKQNIEKILKANNVGYCQIREKYNCENKKTRIELEKGNIIKKLIFPQQEVFGQQTDMGKFMTNLTLYNNQGTNPNDDACLAKGTLIATKFGDIPIEKVKVGTEVITPFGLKKVIASGITGYKPTINKLGLNATSTHKVFDKNNFKFTPLDKLTMLKNCDKLSLRGMIEWKIKLSNLMEKYTKEIQKADITLNIKQNQKTELENRNFIEQCGNITMVKYQKDFKSITKMVTLIIMTFLIWSVYRLGNICQIILRKIGKMKNIGRKCVGICSITKKNNKKQKNGINLQREENGINNMQGTQYANSNLKKKLNANFVGRLLLLISRMANIVLVNANKRHATTQDQKYVKNVEKNFTQQVTEQNNVENVEPVYNLTVENAGCYYANGILVSNCDSLAMFTHEIIDGGSYTPKAIPMIRPF